MRRVHGCVGELFYTDVSPSYKGKLRGKKPPEAYCDLRDNYAARACP